MALAIMLFNTLFGLMMRPPKSVYGMNSSMSFQQSLIHA